MRGCADRSGGEPIANCPVRRVFRSAITRSTGVGAEWRRSTRAQRGGGAIELTAREYRLLEFLMRSAGRICGRMAILEKVWDYDFDPATNLVDVYIRRLREKMDDPFEPRLLHTVRGMGYILKDRL